MGWGRFQPTKWFEPTKEKGAGSAGAPASSATPSISHSSTGHKPARNSSSKKASAQDDDALVHAEGDGSDFPATRFRATPDQITSCAV